MPSESEVARSRIISSAQIAALETLWRTKPGATLEDLDKPDEDGGAGMACGGGGEMRGRRHRLHMEPPLAHCAAAAGVAAEPVQLRYEDGYHYQVRRRRSRSRGDVCRLSALPLANAPPSQNIFGPLVRLESDEDRLTKESWRQDSVVVRWDVALNTRRLARFRFSRPDSEVRPAPLPPAARPPPCTPLSPSPQARLIPGEEMRLKLPSFAQQFGIARLIAEATGEGSAGGGKAGAAAAAADDSEYAWVGTGIVKSVEDGEVTLELTSGGKDVPVTTTNGYILEMVWHSTTFDRMQAALRKFAVDEQVKGGEEGRRGGEQSRMRARAQQVADATCCSHRTPAPLPPAPPLSPSRASSSTRCWATTSSRSRSRRPSLRRTAATRRTCPRSTTRRPPPCAPSSRARSPSSRCGGGEGRGRAPSLQGSLRTLLLSCMSPPPPPLLCRVLRAQASCRGGGDELSEK